MLDIPDGYAAVIVALITALAGVIGVWLGRRASRIALLERENRSLWFALRGVVSVLYDNGIPIPDYLDEIIHPKE